MTSKYTTLDMDHDPPETINVQQQQPTSVLATQPQQPIVTQGLGYLSLFDQILVHKNIKGLCGCVTSNKYEITNTRSQRFLTAHEDSDCLTQLCCGRQRPFDMDLFDNQGNKVLKFERPLAITSRCLPCCLQSLIVTSSEREVIGSVHQEWSILTPHFSVRDASDNVIFIIKGRLFGLSYLWCIEKQLPIFLKDGETQVGRITKQQWSGREQFILFAGFDQTANQFRIEFPMDLDVKMKAVLLGACILIDFMYFEKK